MTPTVHLRGTRTTRRYVWHGVNQDGSVRIYGPYIRREDRWVPYGVVLERNVPAADVQEVEL